MKGDFSRDTFDPAKSFTQVLMQQGRVQVDADWNEQAAIVLGYLRRLAADVIGDHGGPKASFEITSVESNNFEVNGGYYYVQGLRCENPSKISYLDLPNWRRPGPGKPEFENSKFYFVYLDVWERHICHVVDDSIREKALGGPDTATRGQLVWQIRIETTSVTDPSSVSYGDFLGIISKKPGSGELSASATAAKPDDSNPCIISPEARYRGAENQLYRVEIHREKDPHDAAGTATWKWSRDNGAVVFPIRKLATVDKTTVVSVEHLGRDERFGLKAGDWVEVVDDDYELLGLAEPLLKVREVRASDLQVVLGKTPKSSDVGRDQSRHPLLRRWDQRQTSKVKLTEHGVIAVEKPDTWIELEDGISIQFLTNPSQYKTGDYWFIPARVATGDIEWPRDPNDPTKPAPRPPSGIRHYYAPLAHIAVDGGGSITPTSLRKSFEQLAK